MLEHGDGVALEGVHRELGGGEEGLDAYPQVFGAARRLLKPGGWCLVEIGFDQGKSVPALAEAAGDEGGPGGAGISKYVAPRALLWFRWAALVTWLSGAFYLMVTGELINAFTLGATSPPGDSYGLTIGIGAWAGTIMLFNVWILIWPNQKKVLGMVEASEEEKNKAKRTALLASRTNTALSIPMLLFMGAAGHGLPF